MTGSALSCEQCPVADRAICAVLDDDTRSGLIRQGRRRRFGRGDTILAAGDDAATFGTLVSGAAKLSSIDADGTERIVALIHPAGTLGQLFGATQRLSVTALSDAQACLFPRTAIETLTGSQPALAARLLRDALHNLDESRELIDLISHREATGRVAGLLSTFARAASPHACHDANAFELPLTRGEMAQLLGLTIETVSRTLTRFERDGLIRRDGARRIQLRNGAALAALAA